MTTRKIKIETDKGVDIIMPVPDIAPVLDKEYIDDVIATTKKTLVSLISKTGEKSKFKEILKEVEEIEANVGSGLDDAYLLNLKPLLKILSEANKELQKVIKKGYDKGNISASFVQQIAGKREDLLQIMGEDNFKKLQESDSRNYIDRKGKAIAMSSYHSKIIFSLSHYISQSQEEPEVKEAIIAITERKGLRGGFEKAINLKEFYKDYLSPDGKARRRQLSEFFKDLQELASIRQYVVLPNGKKMTSPLISLEEDIRDGNIPELQNIRFSPIFLFNMTKDYFPISKQHLRLWGKRGTGTETDLFNILFCDLGAKFFHYKNTSINKVKGIKRKDFKTQEEYLNEKERVRVQYLTYTQNISTLLDKVPTDYSSKKQYKQNFRNDLEKALRVLRDEFRLIVDWKKEKNKKGEECLSILFNSHYLDDDKKGISV